MSGIIDCHQHFWRPARGDYAWLASADPRLRRDFMPDDLAPMLNAFGVSGTVLVQAAESVAETRFMLDLASRTPWVLGVVGWCDLAAADAAATIAGLAADRRLKGLRPMLQDLDDDDYILSAAVEPALAAMTANGLSLDALVRPRHLGQLPRLRERHPGLAMVVDHAGKPDIASGAHGAWAADLRRVAADGVTCCKLSGLATEAGPDWSVETLRPYVETVLEAFGPERTMWGSDWPVVNLAGGFEAWWRASEALLASLDEAARAAIRGGVADRFYRLGVQSAETQ